MSRAPSNLIDLRRQYAAWTGAKRAAFGIRGFVGAKRTFGYHLGEADIYSPGGAGNRDYSVKRERDKKGLSDYAAGFDISAVKPLTVAELQKQLAWMVTEARAGRLDVAELIGPNENGDATDYRYPDFKPLVRKDPDHNDGHRRHIHVSFWRDLTNPDMPSYGDLTKMFAGYFGEPTQPPADPVLKRGMEGPEVVELQRLLTLHGFTTMQDGVFGPLTEANVKKFQTAEGLTPDGIVGEATWDALHEVPDDEEPADPCEECQAALAVLQKQLAETRAELDTANARIAGKDAKMKEGLAL